MSKKIFDDFLNKQIKEKFDTSSIDWDTHRDEWLKYLSLFYKRVEDFLDEYKKNGKINFEYTNKDIFEEYIGSYSAKILNIQIGNHKIKMEPIGTKLIGAKGRVDLIGANGKVKFVLVHKNLSSPQIKVSIWIEGQDPKKEDDEPREDEWEWKITTPPPRIKYIDFKQDTFLGALMEVVGG